VILIDGSDETVSVHFDNPKLAEDSQAIHDFITVLKASEKFIRFVLAAA
jgi:hypothetical protein